MSLAVQLYHNPHDERQEVPQTGSNICSAPKPSSLWKNFFLVSTPVFFSENAEVGGGNNDFVHELLNLPGLG
jgi:hypothetical protein